MPRRCREAAVIALTLVAIGQARAEVLDSAFTQLDSKKCRHTPGRDVEDYWSWRCSGYKGIPVFLSAGDQRMFVSFGRKAADQPAAGETFPSFNDAYKGTIEWRVEKRPNGEMRPFATILRWNVKIAGDEDTTRASGRFLVVTRLGPGGVCHVAHVDATDDPKANEIARELADKHAHTFQCEKDKVIVVSEKRKDYARPYGERD